MPRARRRRTGRSNAAGAAQAASPELNSVKTEKGQRKRVRSSAFLDVEADDDSEEQSEEERPRKKGRLNETRDEQLIVVSSSPGDRPKRESSNEAGPSKSKGKDVKSENPVINRNKTKNVKGQTRKQSSPISINSDDDDVKPDLLKRSSTIAGSTPSDQSPIAIPATEASDALAHMFDDDEEVQEEMVPARDIRPSPEKDKGKGKAEGWALGEQSPIQVDTDEVTSSEWEDEIARLRKELAFKEKVISAHQALTAQIQNAVNCQICLDTFEDPLTLQCGHTFCRRCLYEYFHKSKVDSDDEDEEQIPIITDPADGPTSDNNPEANAAAYTADRGADLTSGQIALVRTYMTGGHIPNISLSDSDMSDMSDVSEMEERSAHSPSSIFDPNAVIAEDEQSSDDDDESPPAERKLCCPACRCKVETTPLPVFTVREAAMVIRQEEAAGGLLYDSAAPRSVSPKKRESSHPTSYRPPQPRPTSQAGSSRPHPSIADKTWGGLFQTNDESITRFGLRDAADGVYRCARCNWEIYDGVCFQCGSRYDNEVPDRPFHRNRPPIGPRPNSEAGDAVESSSESDGEEEEEEGMSDFINDDDEKPVAPSRRKPLVIAESDGESSSSSDDESEDAEPNKGPMLDEESIRKARLARFDKPKAGSETSLAETGSSSESDADKPTKSTKAISKGLDHATEESSDESDSEESSDSGSEAGSDDGSARDSDSQSALVDIADAMREVADRMGKSRGERASLQALHQALHDIRRTGVDIPEDLEFSGEESDSEKGDLEEEDASRFQDISDQDDSQTLESD